MDYIEEEPWIYENAVHDDTRWWWNNMSTRYTSLRKFDPALASNFRSSLIKRILEHLRIVFLGDKICVLFLAIPLAIVAENYSFGQPWIFALSLLGLVPLAERVSFLTEQIANYTGPTVGGLLNATCGNATELIIAILALYRNMIPVLKYSLLGSILSNLLLVLGSALLCGGLANLNREQKFDKNQSDVSVLLLCLGVLCHLLPFMLLIQYSSVELDTAIFSSALQLSRISSIVMLATYAGYLIFQLKTHNQQILPSQENEELTCNNDDSDGDKYVISIWSALGWLISMTLLVALLSEYVVGTIEAASSSWGLSVRFLSIILLPIVGNAAEHAGAIIFAFRNKLDISLAVALGSATQISMFVVPLCVMMAWIIGIPMGLDLGGLLETVSLVFSVIITALALQDGKSNYMKGIVLAFSYLIISACFFVHKSQQNHKDVINGHIAS